MGLTDRVPGVLEFDFVSIARPSSDTPPLTPGQFDRYVRPLPTFLRHLRVLDFFWFPYTAAVLGCVHTTGLSLLDSSSAGEVVRPDVPRVFSDPYCDVICQGSLAFGRIYTCVCGFERSDSDRIRHLFYFFRGAFNSTKYSPKCTTK